MKAVNATSAEKTLVETKFSALYIPPPVFKRKRKTSDSVLWQKPLHRQNQSTESTERWHLRFTLTIERQYRYIKEYIWFIYLIAPFFSDLKNLLETKNNCRFYILKLFFLLHGNRFSCPVTSLVNISIQSWCILFKIRKNRRFLPNKCFLLLS